jgi:RimJ/RimL family protein N-acetyltransferase
MVVPKLEYLVTRDRYRPSGRELPEAMLLRVPSLDDRDQLASLMLDAYIGTIDYEGEDLDGAGGEVDRYLAAEAHLPSSRVVEREGVIQSGVLLGKIAGLPMVGYVMTRAAVKNRGLASVLVDGAAAATWDDGHTDLRAFITAGNTPSEKLFLRAGFRVIAEHDD